jgi:hypothetical protein
MTVLGVLAPLLLGLSLLVTTVKAFALVIGNFNLVTRGEDLVSSVRSEAFSDEAILGEMLRLSPLDR